MATMKECKCLESVARTVSNAVGLEELSVVASHHGNLRFSKAVYPVPPADTISELIERDALNLREDIKMLDEHCDTKGKDLARKEFYESGKRLLDNTIMTKDKKFDIAFSAGSQTNDFIQDNASLNKLLKIENI